MHGLNEKTEVTWCGVRCSPEEAISFEGSPYTLPRIDFDTESAKRLGVSCRECLNVLEHPTAASLVSATIDRKAAEKVEHPAHYGGADNPYETIKVLEAWLTPEELRGFLKGNAIKYMSRAGKKQGESALDDFKKAEWYSKRAVALEGKK